MRRWWRSSNQNKLNMKPETAKQIQGLATASIPFILVEVRGVKVEKVNYTDKKTHQAASFAFIQYSCESLGQSAEAISVRARLEDGQEATADGKIKDKKTGNEVPFAFKKGDQVLATIKSMELNRGAKTIESIQILAA